MYICVNIIISASSADHLGTCRLLPTWADRSGNHHCRFTDKEFAKESNWPTKRLKSKSLLLLVILWVTVNEHLVLPRFFLHSAAFFRGVGTVAIPWECVTGTHRMPFAFSPCLFPALPGHEWVETETLPCLGLSEYSSTPIWWFYQFYNLFPNERQ